MEIEINGKITQFGRPSLGVKQWSVYLNKAQTSEILKHGDGMTEGVRNIISKFRANRMWEGGKKEALALYALTFRGEKEKTRFCISITNPDFSIIKNEGKGVASKGLFAIIAYTAIASFLNDH